MYLTLASVPVVNPAAPNGIFGSYVPGPVSLASELRLRHTFACVYLKSGGNLEYLRRILGHSSILITQRYFQSIQPEDLQSVHVSPLSKGRWPMRLDAWKEGFEAGRDNDKRCPYHAGSVEAWSWWSGYIEGNCRVNLEGLPE